MALGDHARVENALNYWGGTNQNHINNLRTNLTRQNQGLENRFNVSADSSDADYGRISSGYDQLGGQYGDMRNLFQSYLNGPGISYNPSNQNFGSYSGYQNFADTGGYSGQDIQNLRARANAPMRATYQNAQNDLDRRNVIAGGNLANYGAAKTKMARELSYALGDQSLNTEATLAEAIRSGKLAGLQGMTGIDTSRMAEGLANAGQNLNAQGMNSNRQNQLMTGMLQSLGGQQNALQGQTSLYGATPGRASMYGNQMLNSSGQGIQAEALQNQLMQAIINGTLGMSNVPGNYQQILGNIGSTTGLLGQIGSVLPLLKNLFGNKPTAPTAPTAPGTGGPAVIPSRPIPNTPTTMPGEPSFMGPINQPSEPTPNVTTDETYYMPEYDPMGGYQTTPNWGNMPWGGGGIDYNDVLASRNTPFGYSYLPGGGRGLYDTDFYGG